MSLYYKKWKSPIGDLHLVANDDALLLLEFNSSWERSRAKFSEKLLPQSNAILDLACTELGEYFAGKRSRFSVALLLKGTEFQKKAWQGLRTIPYGKTISYGEQAKRIGKPSAVRAVGAANGRNPISIIIPCHRVIGSGGKLVGYGGGLDMKYKLLELENALPGAK